MDWKLMACAVALCAVFPGTASSADDAMDMDIEVPPEESAYATILTWADTTQVSETGEPDLEAISEGGYSVIRTSWVPPKDTGYSAYPLWGIFPGLLERSGGGTVTAYDGTHPEGRGHLVVHWGNVSADQAVMCAGFGSYETHSTGNSEHHVPSGQYKCPPSPDNDPDNPRAPDRSRP